MGFMSSPGVTVGERATPGDPWYWWELRIAAQTDSGLIVATLKVPGRNAYEAELVFGALWEPGDPQFYAHWVDDVGNQMPENPPKKLEPLPEGTELVLRTKQSSYRIPTLIAPDPDVPGGIKMMALSKRKWKYVDPIRWREGSRERAFEDWPWRHWDHVECRTDSSPPRWGKYREVPPGCEHNIANWNSCYAEERPEGVPRYKACGKPIVAAFELVRGLPPEELVDSRIHVCEEHAEQTRKNPYPTVTF